jgi:formiminoglutamate deiminase
MVKFHFDWMMLASGWTPSVIVETVGGTIEAVGTGSPGPDMRRVRGFALPGFVSLHSHAFQRGMAGLAETRGQGDESFWTWRDVMYRFLDRLGPDDVRVIASQAYLEMLQSGFTSVCEFHYLHNDIDGRSYGDPAEMAHAIAAAAAQTGIGLTLLPTLYRFGGFGEAAAGAGQRRFLNTPDQFARLVDASVTALADLDDARVGVALHSLRAVAPADVTRAARLRPGEPLHIHAAEQEREVVDCQAWSGQRPVQWLIDHAGLDRRWCVIHATHLDEGEVRGLAQSGAVAGLCPITEANLGDGIFPGPAFRHLGGRFGIGTDSNVLISVPEELRVLEYGQRLRDRQRVRMANPQQSVGETLVRAVLAGGTQASGRNTGEIAAGCRADWIVLDDEHPTLAGGNMATLIDRAVFATPHWPIRDVWVGGKHVVVGGRHAEGEAIRTRFKATMRRLELGD